MDNTKDFRTELKNARQVFNISQADFAESLGVSQKHLNRIENCHQYPSFPLLYEMCSKLGYVFKLEFQPHK